jgi:hypothetical protein
MLCQPGDHDLNPPIQLANAARHAVHNVLIVLKDASHAARWVAEQVASGADFVKVIVEDPKVPGTKALPVEVIAAVVSAAHMASKLTVAHAVTTVSVRMADEAGVDVITHAPLNADLAPERLAYLLSRRVVLIPTPTMMRGVVATVTPLTKGPGEVTTSRVAVCSTWTTPRRR